MRPERSTDTVGMHTATGVIDRARYPHEHCCNVAHHTENHNEIIIVMACYCGDIIDKHISTKPVL